MKDVALLIVLLAIIAEFTLTEAKSIRQLKKEIEEYKNREKNRTDKGVYMKGANFILCGLIYDDGSDVLIEKRGFFSSLYHFYDKIVGSTDNFTDKTTEIEKKITTTYLYLMDQSWVNGNKCGHPPKLIPCVGEEGHFEGFALDEYVRDMNEDDDFKNFMAFLKELVKRNYREGRNGLYKYLKDHLPDIFVETTEEDERYYDADKCMCDEDVKNIVQDIPVY